MAAKKTSPRKKAPGKPKSARPTTVAAYLAALPPDRRAICIAAQKFVRANIASDYAEFMSWGVINWGIPLEVFSNTYNGYPLCFVALGANKNSFSLHLLGAYFNPGAHEMLSSEFAKAGKRLDMGKGCLRFKSLDDLELKSVAKVIGSQTAKEYLAFYRQLKGV